MKTKNLSLKTMLCAVACSAFAGANAQTLPDVPIQDGPYAADWESLSAWECPEWFRDAKFGIWAHWGPQCQAEDGDWYGRHMYYPGEGQYNYHVSHFGDPSVYGLKELCRDWKADQWDPDELVALYKSAGAQFFFTLGNHHDNFDLWNSPYQEWNSVNIGPKRDIVGEWAKACEKYGLPLGISIHASHAWIWLEGSQRYDGNLTKEDGKGTWWEGYDPQELYAQRHTHSAGWESSGTIFGQWDWNNGASLPDETYMKKFLNRTLQCINDYHPSIIYFDDTVLPFYGCDDQVGLNILKHYYNKSVAESGNSQTDVVVTGKILGESHKRAILWDVERGIPDRGQDQPWQTCTCIGSWHYDRNVYNSNSYKSAETVIRMLVDVVSKNGNLLLSVPVRANGTIDEKERAIVLGIKAWMDINKESIIGTRPWKTFGEGPLAEAANPLNAQGFNEGLNYTSEDVRYNAKGGIVYATIMQWPSAKQFTFKAFSITSTAYSGQVKSVKLLGYGDLDFQFDDNGLTVEIPTTHPNEIAPVFEITFEDNANNDNESLKALICLVEDKISDVSATSDFNTGKYSPYALDKLAGKLAVAKSLPESSDPKEAKNHFELLREAYADFLANGRNAGGALGVSQGTDVTNNYLMEANNFSSTDASTKRFGTPANWTVENFLIPQTNGNSPKNGIDRYTGQACLMLGVWSGEDGATSSDLANARIYRKVTLPAGRYFFAATYNDTYSINDRAYIFVSEELTSTDELPEKSIAFHPVNQAVQGDGKYYGIEFTIHETKEVYIGWQADLTRGSQTQEFRTENIKLLNRGNLTSNDLATLITKANTALKKTDGRVNGNTGFYDADLVEKLASQIELSNLPESASQADIDTAYGMLNATLSDFNANAKNPHGVLRLTDTSNLPEGWTDITLEKLQEKSQFSRTDASTTRFGTPLYWMVENFHIPNGADGTKNGIDRYTGEESLMLGVWNDRASNNSGALTNARIYQQIHLDKGRYYFGATYNADYQLYRAYIFAASQLIATGLMEQDAIAFDPISQAATDGLFYGIYFTLEEAQDIFLGFQANLASGSDTQEFRADAVRLLKLDDDNSETNSVTQPFSSETAEIVPACYYTLTGMRLSQAPQHGIYVERKDGLTRKIFRK